MFTCYRITDVEYYLAEADRPADDPGPSGRDRAAYYVDNGAGEGPGTWWRLPTELPFPLVQRGAEVPPRSLRDMARGLHPVTRRPMIQTTRTERTVGYDCQFAAPKSVSVLWATASPDLRRSLEAAQDRAVDRAMDFLHAEGLVVTRRGKGGALAEPVADVAAARFRHTTSRDGDPQLHTHAVLLNVAVRQDGTTGTIDNQRILAYQGAVGAIYRTELASILEGEMGLATERAGRNFRVLGIPDEAVAAFSKRRAAIEGAAAEAGYSTAGDRERARLEAVRTRRRKADLAQREELEQRWRREVEALGWSAAALWESARAARVRRSAEVRRERGDEERRRADERRAAGLAAIAELEAHDAVLERRRLLCAVLERCQTLGTVAEALDAFERLEREGHLVRLDTTPGNDEALYATPRMIALERQMLCDAVERKAERWFVSPEAIEAAIARRPGLSREQADFVRHTAGRDGVTVGEGFAGTGKSFSLGTVAEIHREAGADVWVVAPSWKATGVVRDDTGTAEAMARAMQGFVARLDPTHRDHVALTRASCVIVDEAGMVGTAQMAPLLAAARKAGAKVILAGDRRQLQPVTAGAPLAAIAGLCGTSRIAAIRRQRLAWQRAASTDLATGHAGRALDAYDRAGRITWADGRGEALEALAAAWRADVGARPTAGPQGRLVLASRNVDLRELNPVLRAAYRDAGLLAPEAGEVTVRAVTRGRQGAVAELQLAGGDRLIFGESVEVGGVTIRNSDMATVEGVVARRDPLVRIRLDKGDVVEAPWSLFGRAPRGGAPREPPKAQHAYAVTVHAAQGTTVDRAFVLNAHGMGAQSAYVAMTRHRDDVVMVVDTSRVRDSLEAKRRGGTIAVSSVGGVSARDAEDEAVTPVQGDATFSPAEVLQVVRAEVLRSEAKLNVSDFVADVPKWLAAGTTRSAGSPQPSRPMAFSPLPLLTSASCDPNQRNAAIDLVATALDAVMPPAARRISSQQKASASSTVKRLSAAQILLTAMKRAGEALGSAALRERMQNRLEGPNYTLRRLFS